MKKETKLIFDVQLFAGTESVTGTSAGEQITIASTGVVSVTNGSKTLEKKPLTSGNTFDLVSGGSGNDSITVASGVNGISVVGGRGNDSITSNGEGNTYIYYNGDGKDTIYSWDSSKDKLSIASSAAYTTLMSEDGKSFIVSVGSGYVQFNNINAVGETAGKVNVNGEDKTALRIRQGSAKADNIDNSATGSVEGGSGKAWSIDGGLGNDTITNAAKYVSINGGYGNDKIVIKANGTTVTDGVTVNAGYGNDTIDATGDKSGDNYGGHVYQYKKRRRQRYYHWLQPQRYN